MKKIGICAPIILLKVKSRDKNTQAKYSTHILEIEIELINMQNPLTFGLIIIGYVIGAVPVGLLIVKRSQAKMSEW
ncbi:MAG: hypothetical protein CM1200mP6_00550 [Anaerolineaceae bacterium]|nr:MAG: hypothetical protein CM1200mP6_00550 [Anaerolineaceae bacterium]